MLAHRRRLELICLGLALWCGCAPLSGCAVYRCIQDHNLFRPAAVAPPAIGMDATVEDVVAHLNANIERAPSWQSSDISISAQGQPVSLNAHLVVQAPRNLRLQVRGMIGPEVDLGSNDDHYWVWVKRAPEKQILMARHIDTHRVRLPFEPDWLVQALGVMPINGDGMTMRRDAQNPQLLHLVAETYSPDGLPVFKVLLVNAQSGFIQEHSVYGSEGNLIARAVLGDYRIDESSGAALPHRVEISWPAAQMALTMRIGRIESNPASVPSSLWELPEYTGYPVFDMGRGAAQ